MSSVEPDEHANQQHASKERIGELVVARGDAAVLLDLVEEALDEIALAVEGEVGLARLLAVGLGWDDRRDATLLEILDERICVVALVGDDGLRLEVLEQRPGLRDVGRLSRRERKRDGVAESIDDGVDLGRQSTT